MIETFSPSLELARTLVAKQFPQYADLPILDVQKQGHDNRTYRLGTSLLIRMPTAATYALKVPKEQQLLPQLAKRLTLKIPAPIAMGQESELYPYPFSLYQWLPGQSLNLITLKDSDKERLAYDLAAFLKELQNITDLEGPKPGQHNWWRGDHISVYDQGARQQIAQLQDEIDVSCALELWERACATKWSHTPVWIHGDLAIGNLVLDNRQLSAVIDFGGCAVGDPACDLVMAWTYFSGKSREIFMSQIPLDSNTWLRARAWVLWKATYELCQIRDKKNSDALLQKSIINDVIKGFPYD